MDDKLQYFFLFSILPTSYTYLPVATACISCNHLPRSVTGPLHVEMPNLHVSSRRQKKIIQLSPRLIGEKMDEVVAGPQSVVVHPAGKAYLQNSCTKARLSDVQHIQIVSWQKVTPHASTSIFRNHLYAARDWRCLCYTRPYSITFFFLQQALMFLNTLFSYFFNVVGYLCNEDTHNPLIGVQLHVS